MNAQDEIMELHNSMIGGDKPDEPNFKIDDSIGDGGGLLTDMQ